MTRTDTAIAAGFGLCTLFAVSYGGQCIGAAQWDRALGAYLFAALCLCGLAREVQRAMPPGDYTDDIPDRADTEDTVGDRYTGPRRRPRTRRMGRLRAARLARRETAPDGCTCELWWTSFGAAHEEPCPAYQQSSA